MAYADKRKGEAYRNEYARDKYDRISVVVTKGKRDQIKARAESLGQSVSSYINNLIDQDMQSGQ